jgi:hypothetical protein
MKSDKAQALREQESSVAEDFFQGEERRLWHEFPDLSGGLEPAILKTSGQFDIALVHPKSRRALIFDGKSGWLPVSPNPSNLQLRRLAALLWLQVNPIEIGVCILKPFGKTESPCVYTVSDLERSLIEMQEHVRQSHEPDAPRTAGEEQCRYCRAREGVQRAWLGFQLPYQPPCRLCR